MSQPVSIELTEPELIVLNAVLSRLAERPDFGELVPDKADRQALHNLVCLLERADPVVFADDYADRITEARERLLDDR
jgi:hypothetical protein